METNFSRYKFSEEAQPELTEFFKAVAQQEPLPSPLTKLWKKILPLDEATQERIKSFKSINEPVVECIEISDDEVQIQEETLPRTPPKPTEASFAATSSNEASLNVTQAEDLIDVVRELLENDSTVPNSIVKQFGKASSRDDVKNMFDCFGRELNSKSLLTLWKSIAQTNFLERPYVVKMFLDCILLGRILKEQDSLFKTLLSDACKEFPNETSLALQVLLIAPPEKPLQTFKSNLTSLPDACKNVLLMDKAVLTKDIVVTIVSLYRAKKSIVARRNGTSITRLLFRSFLENINQLEVHQLENITCLLSKSIDDKTLNKLIELMFHVAKDFTSNKIFGKLLFEVVQNLSTSVLKNEEQLQHIIMTHNSIFKSQIIKSFQNYLQDVKMMSQSLRA